MKLYIKALLISIITMLCLAEELRSQTIRCGVESYTPEEVLQIEELLNEWLEKGNMIIGPQIVYIPIVVHVIRYDNGSADVSDQQINDQIDAINTGFANTNFRFRLYSTQRINNTFWTTNTFGSLAENDMKAALSLDPDYFLNLYICDLPGILGYARFPWENIAKHLQGVVVSYKTLPGGSLVDYNEGDTGTHEIGHFCGLYHTFQNGCNEPGDAVEDTPFQLSATVGCPSSRNSCPQPGDDPIHNFMDYSSDPCLDHFTQGQFNRMKHIMSQYRSKMVTPLNITLNQKNSSSQPVGTLKLWESNDWSSDINSGTTLNLWAYSNYTFQGAQQIISNEKYNVWKKGDEIITDIINHHTFLLMPTDVSLTSQFDITKSNVVINNTTESSAIIAGNLKFKDPWLIDYADPLFGNSVRNRGMKESGPDKLEFKERSSPFYPDYTTNYNGDVYKGVFLDQDYLDPNKPYYSVQAIYPQTCTLAQTNREHTFYFQNWSANTVNGVPGAVFQNANSPTTGVVFKKEGAVVSANMKGTQLSSQSEAFKHNGQNKIVRISGNQGIMYQVYESMGNLGYKNDMLRKKVVIESGCDSNLCS
ncbi:MAG: zinc metalloprotease [Ignavibacteriaceae bacterium]|nr:zinc metalloprotease [Ignavibacteriaceae bacterium]